MIGNSTYKAAKVSRPFFYKHIIVQIVDKCKLVFFNVF